ncbi:MAG: NAD(P)-binding protein, partial [Candidatus Poribacteria bacterium]
PRYVDEEKCNNCGKCIEVCTVTVNNEFNLGIDGHKAIDRLFPQAVPAMVAVDKLQIPRCRAACPIHTNVQGYVSLIANGKFAEAYQVNKEVNPFPSICGRVCNHPCESACLRNRYDDPVSIMFLKRAATDYVFSNNLEEELEPMPPPLAEDCKSVAVIGAGPSGLASANDLAMLGYKVTVFESLPVAGGMLAVGIPEFRLPKATLQKEIELIEKKGVEIKLNARLGRDITLSGLLADGYDAVYVAIGAHGGRRLGIEGEDLPQVVEAVDFLRRLNLGEEIQLPPKVMVIGGGNVAIDASRSALRLGADEVTILYRRSKEEMPADEWEVQEAEEDGVKIEFLTNPTRIIAEDGKVSSIECVRMELGEPDESGRRRPIPIQGSEFTMPADMVIEGIGQATESDFLSEGEDLKLDAVGTIQADPETCLTSMPGVFAGGDAVTGPQTVVEAIAAGKKAARAIHRYLNGEELAEPMLWETKTRELPDIETEEYHNKAEIKQIERQDIPRLEPSERARNFDEVQLGFDFDTAIQQAQRCLNCAVCSDCHECVKVCDPDAIDHEMGERMLQIDVGSVILAPGYDTVPAAAVGEYGYGRYENVITSLEFERYLSASGPTSGDVIRPSDHEPPKRIAFIQCVGSRDFSGRANEYCCSVGCMYAVKQAVIAQEHLPGVEVTIFFIDVRTHGKGYEDYYVRAEKEYGVRCVRSLVSSVKEMKQTNNLRLRYIDESGKNQDEDFDLVVLTVGLGCPSEFTPLSDAVGIERNEYGLCQTDIFSTINTTRDGIFVCGAITEPKDIPDSVVQ